MNRHTYFPWRPITVLVALAMTSFAIVNPTRNITGTRAAKLTTGTKHEARGRTNVNAPAGPALGTIFELDGNAISNGTGLDDWAILDAGGGSAVARTVDSNGQPVNIPDPDGQTIFTTGGSKDPLDIPNWHFTGGSVPDKDEITNANAAAYTAPNNDLIVVFGADRFAQNGDSQIGFWFFKSDVHPIPGTGNFSGQHQIGDLLVLSNFTQGGGISTILVYEWVGSGGSDGTLNLVASSTLPCSTATVACGQVNTASTPAPWPYTPKSGPAGSFPQGGFYEGGINLTQLGISNECFSSFLAETRSSQSVSATLKDFVEGHFNLTPDVSAGPDAIINCTNPTAQLTASSSLEPNVTFHWTTSDGNITSNPDAKTITVDRAGTYTVTVNGAAGCSSSDSAVVTADFTAPDVSAGPDGRLTCAITSIALNGSTSIANPVYAWSTSTGHIVGASNGASIMVDAAGTYTLTVTNPANGCASSDDAVVVSDTAVPTVAFSKTGADGNALSVTLTTVASSNATPAGTLSYQYQTCIANCGVDASWANAGSNQATFTFSNFSLAAAAATSFSIGSDAYSGQLFVVNTRVNVTDSSNGCHQLGGPVAVKKVTAVDP